MHLAQLASSYETEEKLGGTLLTEHRRCVDQLVEFSNEYVYNNKLKPMVGSSEGTNFKLGEYQIYIPALGYLNIQGNSEKDAGSIYNTKEAESISGWIKEYGDCILNYYNTGKSGNDVKKLKDVIAVITPFSAQKNKIYEQFEEYSVDKGITVGTVHALQGAERNIVIFSPAYGMNHDSKELFFDRGYNMLNVALTRAKQHFIIIGNIRLFNQNNLNKPSGGLAKHLFASELNELSSSIYFDNNSDKIKDRVNTLELHQWCIKRAFETAKNRIIIVSPFISITAIRADKLLSKIQEAISNKIEVHIYTDKHLDMSNDVLKEHSKIGREELIKAGAKLFILNGIHNKAIAIDEEILIEGSFNWLSASRDKSNNSCRHEISQIIKGEEAKVQISQLIMELSRLSLESNKKIKT